MKVGIVGSGHVGSTAAYSITLQGISTELVLVDSNPDLAEAHRMDILHATPFAHPVRLRAGRLPELAGCGVVILAAGAAQVAGESRMQLLSRNAGVFANLVPEIVRHAGNPILLVASNPLDIMTHIATALSGLPPSRVLGSGTMLDTARFRSLLAERFRVSPSSAHAYVPGEHGDSEVLIWSTAQVAGVPLKQFGDACGMPLDAAMMDEIDKAVRGAANRIIAGKGATYYGIGAALARLVRCIVNDERAVFTACSMAPEIEGVKQVALSLPLVIGSDGVQRQIRPQMNDAEAQALGASARLIKQAVSQLGY
ncbi:L-lactate dehydrogenase [Noviherbaspirillum massiliense]|uniref:L-lactate dehydrogenase n=1 Tax=Noviherbaspirillum massiliense TaxID=1465823 RepID=UPI00031C12DD|nr:L-lactate dehydrogenase [Noviherbaspirillum massiliense]